jgi:hypothetical protein
MSAKTSADRKRTLLRAIEQALFDAISQSEELHRSLWRLQRAGYTLHLTLDCRTEPGAAARVEAAADAPSAADATGAARAEFRMDGDDLRFLHSVGIDPTRSGRRRGRS